MTKEIRQRIYDENYLRLAYLIGTIRKKYGYTPIAKFVIGQHLAAFFTYMNMVNAKQGLMR